MSHYRDNYENKFLVQTDYHGKWCLILINNIPQPYRDIPFTCQIHHQDTDSKEDAGYLVSHHALPTKWRTGLVYLPKGCQALTIQPVFHPPAAASFTISMRLYALSRPVTAFFIILNHPVLFMKSLIKHPLHPNHLVRMILHQGQRKESAALSYSRWHSYYDRWTDQEKATLSQSPYADQWPLVQTRIYDPSHAFHYTSKTIRNKISQNASGNMTRYSLAHSWHDHSKLHYHATTSKRPVYIAFIQNGEIIRPHAMTVFADQAARHHYPAALYADSDQYDGQQYSAPLFKPDPALPTLLSGLLTQDVWLVKKEIVEAFQQSHPQPFNSAYGYRLALALFIWEHHGLHEEHWQIHHIPFILSHRTTEPTDHDKKEMIGIIDSFAKKNQWTIRYQSSDFPFQLQFRASDQPVSLIVPTTISSRFIQDCLLHLISNTHYPVFEMILVISQQSPLSSHQQKLLSPLLAYHQVRVLLFPCDTFNFSSSCNFAIAQARFPFIVLLNDDVKPKTPDWLVFMMGHMQNEQVGAVGAKLHYPNGKIQHAGILMGSANLCEHVGRFQKSDSHPVLTHDHDVCAVTGACMLIRRKAYDHVQGLDETYEIAYNDVDFCLRLHQAGFHVIQCQQAQLIHFESFSLGHHYKGKRAGKERQEILSIRHAYQALCQYDPYYNPNLSLQKGKDHHLSFPPRLSRPFGND